MSRTTDALDDLIRQTSAKALELEQEAGLYAEKAAEASAESTALKSVVGELTVLRDAASDLPSEPATPDTEAQP